MLDSLVASVDLYDLVCVKKRRDKLVSVTMRGQGSESIPYEENNAVRSAELFISKYSTCGADITVYKNIPMGLGLGGSSADSAGVLNALSRLYRTDDPAGLKILADATGSDTRYMLSGGYARLFGRGDEVKAVESGLKLDFLLLAPKDRVSTGKCFAEFDRSEKFGGDSGNGARKRRQAGACGADDKQPYPCGGQACARHRQGYGQPCGVRPSCGQYDGFGELCVRAFRKRGVLRLREEPLPRKLRGIQD